MKSAVQVAVSSVNTVISSALAGVNDVLHIVGKSVSAPQIAIPDLTALDNGPTSNLLRGRPNCAQQVHPDLGPGQRQDQCSHLLATQAPPNGRQQHDQCLPIRPISPSSSSAALNRAPGLCTVGLEWCAWRSIWRHVRLIRDICGREKGESIDVQD
ncbi:hypothetical protein A4X13_0g2372 [Tilletia indica]|uniref:Uncharacterized protein n=1 Tax=Tilletia indica TaxID=43049 RepID=A0A8T8TAJ0_9BASI|nr:hypothetical protein A4X13_0g2372 [Tilletia indica]